MKKYAFVLGNNMALSIAEISAVFRREGMEHRILEYSSDILLVECGEIKNDFIKTLGGTIKIIEIFSEDESMPTLAEIIETLSKEISKNYISGKKFHLGISIYDLGTSKSKMKKYYMLLRKIYVTIKKEMSKEGIKIAFPSIKGASLSSASVIKNDLLTSSGAEYSLILRAENMLIGKTVAVQDIDFFSQIDYGRPVRDTVSGTTPPKLAMIMINLAGKEKDAVMYDPFCGSGTYLQQMSLAGYKNIYGSDISEKAMADTEENLAWLKNKFSKIASLKLFISDVAEISKKIDKKVDAIVSETYLGPPLKKEPTEKELSETMKTLVSIYESAFREFSKILQKDGKVVLAIPVFRIKNRRVYVEVEKILGKNNFKIVDIAKELTSLPLNQLSYRHTIVYSRPDQLVQREILVLEKMSE